MTPSSYRPDERPDIEVLRDGVWYPGELRAWQQRADGWWANVNWTHEGMRYLETVPASSVRLVSVGPSRVTDGTTNYDNGGTQ